jgi:hypothetical protein
MRETTHIYPNVNDLEVCRIGGGKSWPSFVTAAELLSVAAFREGRHAQAFPSFGSERTGAPVVR